MPQDKMWWDCLSENYVISLTSCWSQDKMWWYCLSEKCVMSLTNCWWQDATGQDVMRLPFRTMCNVTHFLLVIGQDVMGLLFRKMSYVTHQLVVMRQNVMRLPFRKMCNVTHKLSMTRCHRTRCDEIAFQKKWPMTLTSYQAQDKMWWYCLSDKCAMTLTSYWLQHKMWWYCLSDKMCNDTHHLLVIEIAFQTDVHWHSPTVGHRTRCDEIIFQKICNVTHQLLVGEDLVRLPLRQMCNVTHFLVDKMSNDIAS